jgi:tetratricopeptide (TPR) repeat protein
MAELPEVGRLVLVDQVVLRTSLAQNLGQLGKLDEALALARDATERADRTLADDSLDRVDAHSTLAEVLRDVGQFDAALVESHKITAVTKRTVGERSERYGSAIAAEADSLAGLHRYREADTAYARACDIIAFRSGETTSEHAACLGQRAEIVEHLGRARDSLALADQAYSVLARVYGTAHPSVGAALYVRGLSHADLGEHDLALADLEQSLASYHAHAVAGGYVARSEWALAKLLWPSDRARANQLIDDAMTKLDSPAWRDVRDAIVAWRAANR